MKYTLVIQVPPTRAAIARSALHFARALVAQHEIFRVFFYGDGVFWANQNIVAPQDEDDLSMQWREFIQEHSLDAVVCIATAIQRGLLDENECQRYERLGQSISSPYELSGLGQLVESLALSDRVVSFQ